MLPDRTRLMNRAANLLAHLADVMQADDTECGFYSDAIPMARRLVADLRTAARQDEETVRMGRAETVKILLPN